MGLRLRFLALLMLIPVMLLANPYRGDVGTVVIDAGHGGSDPGALGQNVQEKDLTLSIALALQSGLEERGCTTLMTRDDDSTLSLEERCDVANSADFPIEAYPIFVSIHINSAHSEAAEGFEV